MSESPATVPLPDTTQNGFSDQRSRILVVKLSSLGDLFHVLPAVTMIKQGLNASVDWVTTDTYCDLVAHFRDVDRAIPFYRRSFLGDLRPFLRDLRRDYYDLILDFQGLFKSGLVTRLARGKQRIGPSFHREGSRMFYTRVAAGGPDDRHAVDRNLDIVRLLGLPVGEREFAVDFPAQSIADGRPRVAMLPVSRWPTKNWPALRFAKLGNMLREAGVASLYLLGGPDDRPVCTEIEHAIDGPVHNLAGKLSLAQTGGLLKEMDLLIANDSGPVHMAAAIGTACLVMFGPTDQARTGPYGDIHRVLTCDLPCRPCMSRKCRIETQACLCELMPATVRDAALSMISHQSSVISDQSSVISDQ